MIIVGLVIECPLDSSKGNACKSSSYPENDGSTGWYRESTLIFEPSNMGSIPDPILNVKWMLCRKGVA